MALSSVLLPDPLGPIRPWKLFSPIAKPAPSSAFSAPKLFLMPCTVSNAMVGCGYFSRRPNEPMRSRVDTSSPSRPEGLKVTTSNNNTPNNTGQYCLTVCEPDRK